MNEENEKQPQNIQNQEKINAARLLNKYGDNEIMSSIHWAREWDGTSGIKSALTALAMIAYNALLDYECRQNK